VSADDAAVLTGTVTITGTETGFVPVTVPKDMSLGDPFITRYRAAVTVTGGGPAAGFALVEDDLQGAVLVGGRSEAYEPYVERHGIPVSGLLGTPRPDAKPYDGTYAIPAGSYRLYLVTGGKPTTVTLRFIGASGVSRLTPTNRSDSVVQGRPLDVLVPGPVGGVYSGGGAATMTTPVLQFGLNTLDTDVHTETVQRYCFYIGTKPTGPQAYGPGCVAPGENDSVAFAPGGTTFLISDEGVGQASYYGFSASLTTSRGSEEPVEADLATGTSFTSGGLVTGGDYSQFWLSLNPTSASAARTADTDLDAEADRPASGFAPGGPAAHGAGAAVNRLPATGLGSSFALAPLLLVAAAGLRRRSGGSSR
jgi:hypothetical protein